MGVFLFRTMSALRDQSYAQLAEHAVVVGCALYLARKLFKGGIVNNLTRWSVNTLSALPGGKAVLDSQTANALADIEGLVFNGVEDEFIMENIPEEGLSHETVMKILRDWRAKEKGYKEGKAFGGIYTDDHQLEELEKEALALYCDSNGLHPTTFPALRKIEAEVVRMACNLLHGDEETCGTMTSGGSESIIIAMKAYRDRAKTEFGITEPEVIVPDTAHAAFIKGAHYFGMKLVYARTNPTDSRVDISHVAELLNRNTVMVVGSAPSFPHGVIDGIKELAQLVKNQPQTGLHVDACLGGFILPWLQELGHINTKYDFEVEGVTSISADLHKYAFCPKGASVILWKNKAYRKHQYFAYCDWNGGLYCSPAVQGSRAGGPMAGAWAVLVNYGRKGFLRSATQYQTAYTTVLEGVRGIPDLRVLGQPEACTIAYTSDSIAIFKIGDAMEKKGWSVNRLQRPACLQLQVGARSNFDAAAYVADLKASVEDVKNNPENYKGGMAGVYGLAANLAEAHAILPLKQILCGYMDILYQTRPSK